ncbi:MAG: HlyD family efflux transporter periplasmic adaptor subunit [Bacteroidia bacterium]|nr:HlyD family efflux transporter periplasmic adaptor subunit [Bacteroidia bacterium]
MDRKIERKRFDRKKIGIILTILFVVTVLVILLVRSNRITTTIDISKAKTGEVRYGDFQEIVLVNGSAEPISTVLVDAREGGVIQRIEKEEGELVKAGDVLLVLSNEAVMLDFMQRETQIVEQINNLRNTRIALYQNQRRTEDQLIDFQNQLQLATRRFKVDSGLYLTQAISQQQYFESKTNYGYLQQKVKTEKIRIDEDLTYQKLQIGRIDASISMMERNLAIIKKKLENLAIVAPKSGQLNSFNHEIGSALTRNETIGRIDDPDGFLIQANVDQHYLPRINQGQSAFVKSGNREYPMVVNKIFPTINQGQFRIDLHFEQLDSLPNNLRRGQNFQVFIETSAQKMANMVPRGSFYQSSGGQYVYVVDRASGTAAKRQVQLGAQNPDYYEVLSGLDEGEEILISSYDAYKDNETIYIN